MHTQIRRREERHKRFFKKFSAGTSSLLFHQVLWLGQGFVDLQVLMKLPLQTPLESSTSLPLKETSSPHLRVSSKPSYIGHRVSSILPYTFLSHQVSNTLETLYQQTLLLLQHIFSQKFHTLPTPREFTTSSNTLSKPSQH